MRLPKHAVRKRGHLSALAVALAVLSLATTAHAPAAATSVRVAFLQGEQIAYADRPGATLHDALRSLLAGPNPAEKAREITTQIPAGTPLREVTLEGSVATVDLGEQFAAGTSAESLTARVAQVVLTATRFPGVHSVRLLVKGGTPLGLFPGVVTRYPLTAKDVERPDLPPPGTPAPPPPTGANDATRRVQERLAALGFLVPQAVDGRPGLQTTSAVVAFQKWSRLARDGDAGPATLAALASAARPQPIGSGSGKRVEVLHDRQLALVIDGGWVVRILDVSTGKPGYETPIGAFRVTRQEERSWSVPYKVWLPWASYFVGGVAFHEYPDVPPAPASHGCVRVPRWDAEWLYRRLANGTPVTVIGKST